MLFLIIIFMEIIKIKKKKKLFQEKILKLYIVHLLKLHFVILLSSSTSNENPFVTSIQFPLIKSILK